MKTFKEFLESKKLQLALDVEGEPVVVGSDSKSKKGKKDKKLKRTLDDEGEPVTI